jgi:hypothetical protein
LKKSGAAPVSAGRPPDDPKGQTPLFHAAGPAGTGWIMCIDSQEFMDMPSELRGPLAKLVDHMGALSAGIVIGGMIVFLIMTLVLPVVR